MRRFGISSRPQHLGGLLSYQAASRPDAEFAIFIEQHRRLTFGEANRLANRFGRGLHRAGIEQHRPVCLMMPNVWEMLISEYGAHKIGAIAVEINAAFRGPGLARMINMTESELLVVHETLVPAVDDLEGELPFLRHVLVPGADPPRAVAGVPAASWDSVLGDDESDPDVAISTLDVASIMFTSGTTGVSKGCVLSHRYGIYIAVTTIEALRITSEDCTYTGYPIYHMGTAYSEVRRDHLRMWRGHPPPFQRQPILGRRPRVRSNQIPGARFSRTDSGKRPAVGKRHRQSCRARVGGSTAPRSTGVRAPVWAHTDRLLWVDGRGRPGVFGSGRPGALGERRTGPARIHDSHRRPRRRVRSDRNGGRDS